MIKVYDKFDDHLQTLWRNIEKESICTPFQTFSWCRALWDCVISQSKGNSLFVIYSEDEKTRVSLLMPLFVDESGTLRFIGDGHSDIGDAIISGDGSRHYLFNDVSRFILSQRQIRNVVFQKMPPSSETLSFLGVLFKGSILYRDHAYSWINLSKSAKLPFGYEHLRSRERKQFNAMIRRYADVSLAVSSHSRGQSFPIGDIVEMRDFMVARRWRKPAYLSSEITSFLNRCYDEDRLDVYFLEQNGQKKSVSLILRHGGFACSYLMLYRDKEYNAVLNAHIIDSLSAEGVGVYNFGVGAYDYKLKKFRPELSCTCCLRYSKSRFRRFCDYLMMIVRFVRQG